MLYVPHEVMPVVEVLRREVKRPNSPQLSLHGKLYFWTSDAGPVCPMGLHPASVSRFPTRASWCGGGLRKLPDHDIARFAYWWDDLVLPEAQEAMDFIWPPPAKKARPAAGAPSVKPREIALPEFACA